LVQKIDSLEKQLQAAQATIADMAKEVESLKAVNTDCESQLNIIKSQEMGMNGI
jgi:hypothetical protein